ncbi:MAG: hypothetical protein Q7J72_01300 [Candidatus Omnitrophota bacterium]|nr:hypothetical protein [Candidatus Omnitrophota bacterium]
MWKKNKILALIVVFLFAFCIARDIFIKSLIGSVAGSVTGAPTRIGGFSLSVIRQTVEMTDFKMYNPHGFPRDILVDIPKISISWNLGALLKGKIHLKEIDFELKEVGMTENEEGKLNVDSLKITEDKKAGTLEKEATKPAKELAIQIDLVNLAIGRIVSKDYSVKGPPAIKVYEVNLKKSYKNITSVQQLVALIISEPLKAAGIRGLKVYAASMLAGVAAMPVAAVFTFAGKDYTQASFDVTTDKAYNTGLEVLKQMGAVRRENKTGGVISAEVSGAKVTFRLKKLNDASTEITISARKLGLPKPEVASGVIYQITDRLK